MQFGLGIPTCREGRTYPCGFADLPQIAALAREAERLGFDSLWANDHLATQRGEHGAHSAPANFYEPLITFAYLAGQTSRLRFVVATIVAPLRQPVLLAKQAATLDVLSGGRLTLGVGAGYLEPEFRAVGANFAERGAVTDEYLDAMRSLWYDEQPEFRGRFAGFGGVDAHPRPVQRPIPLVPDGPARTIESGLAAVADLR
jgi:probable F420-dependent oxidoreductase